MTAGEIAILVTAILTGIGGLITAVATWMVTARKSEIEGLRMLIQDLREENDRLCLRVEGLEHELAEKQRRISVLEKSLRDQTQARADRERRIQELETEVVELQTKVTKLETDTGRTKL